MGSKGKMDVHIPTIAIIRLIVFLFLGVVGFAGYGKAQQFFLTNEMFLIKDVRIDRSMSFMDYRELKALVGRNIFNVDVQKVHQRILQTYPFLTELKVTKEMPSQIRIYARKRETVAALRLKSKWVLMDVDRVAMMEVVKLDGHPEIIGALRAKQAVMLGKRVKSLSLEHAVAMITAVNARGVLKRLKLVRVDVSNPSRYELYFASGFKIVLDKNHYLDRWGLLETLITQRKLDTASTLYVDLRFDEPVMKEQGADAKTSAAP